MHFFKFSVRLKGTTFFKSGVTLSAGSSGQEKSILQHTSLVHATFSSDSQGIFFLRCPFPVYTQNLSATTSSMDLLR